MRQASSGFTPGFSHADESAVPGYYSVKRDFNRFMYGDWVKLEEIGPLPTGPLEPPIPRHSPSCLCGPCSVAGQVYADYLQAKANDGL